VTLDLTLVQRAVLKLLCLLMLAGCTYGPPVYRGDIENVALLGDGRVAIGYSQSVSRRPTGLAAWPDGGRSLILHDQFLVALVDPAGRTGEIARYENEALPGSGAIRVNWFEADPDHLYVTLSGQLSTDLPLRRLNQTRRIDLNGREIARFDMHRELAARGRDFGAKHAGVRLVDARGTIFAGATRNGIREMWRRDANGTWTLFARFDDNPSFVGDDFVYRLGDYIFARNWSSGEVRKLVYFNPSTHQSETIDPGEPALAHSDYEPTISASAGSGRKEIHIMRDNDRIASITSDARVLDRR